MLIRYLILFIPKKDNKFRLCIDYRQFNVIIKKNCYLLLFIVELKDRLTKARWFTALDLSKVYNLFWIKQRYKWKTIFKTKFEHFKYLILPFRFINILTTFQVIINYILKDFIDRIVVIYLDDIFIFNKTLEEYKKYIYLVLITLEQTNLYINIHKSTFYSQKIDYLKFKIKLKTIEINNKKIKVVR